MVPVMVMLETPARTSPVATVVAALCILWNDPDHAHICRTRPVAAVPVIRTLRRIPVAVDPHELVIFRCGAWRANGDRSGWRRCADLNSNRYLAERCGRTSKKCACEQQHSYPRFVVEFHVP